MRIILTLLVAVVITACVVTTRAAAVTAEANTVAEVTFTASKDASVEGAIELDAVFTTPTGDALRVPAFWAGGRTWKVRYASSQPGAHAFVTECSDATDTGLHAQRGVVTITRYTGDNPLYKHGPLRVSDDRRHFVHTDGKPFFWLADTWWMGLSSRLTWPDGFKQLTADRKAKGFTVVQIVGGLCPDMIPFDERGAGDGGQAWTPGYGRIRPEFFNEADKRIQHLVEQGVTPCIVGAWYIYLPVMGPEKLQRHWRNLIARYGAYPVVWVVGGEINNKSGGVHFAKREGFEIVVDDTPEARRAAWTQVARYLQTTDPSGRIVGAHNVQNYHVFDDPTLLDMYFLQSGHSSLSSIACQTSWFADLSRAEHRGPLVMSEANYQGLFTNVSYWDNVQRHQFYVTMLDGGAGHTYGANGIWQANQPGKPYGPSPHGFSWGNVPWSTAMQYPASTQLGLGKAMLCELPWTRLVPSSDSVRFVLPELPDIAQSGATWQWAAEDNGRDLLMGTSFELPADATVRRAVLRLACGDRYGLTINQQAAHRYYRLDYPQRDKHAGAWVFPLAGSFLQAGRNVLLLRFSDHARITQRSALLGHIHVELTDGRVVDTPLNDWRWQRPKIGWPGDVMQLDPAEWDRCVDPADTPRAGQPLPWRQLDPYGPRCASIPGKLWVIYAPDCLDVELANTPPGAALDVTRFNPRTGEREQLGETRADAFGRHTLRAPRDGGDWVWIVRAK